MRTKTKKQKIKASLITVIVIGTLLMTISMASANIPVLGPDGDIIADSEGLSVKHIREIIYNNIQVK